MQTKHYSAEMCVKYANESDFILTSDADERRCICLINNVTSCARLFSSGASAGEQILHDKVPHLLIPLICFTQLLLIKAISHDSVTVMFSNSDTITATYSILWLIALIKQQQCAINRIFNELLNNSVKISVILFI